MKTATGVVIRSRDIELLALQGRKAVARVRVPMEGADTAFLPRALQQALAASGLKVRKLSVSIPSQDVLLRFFTIPMVPKPEWDAAVQFEARKYIPFKTDQLIWDYHIVPSAEANRLDVVFAAITQDLFRAVQEACMQAGVQPALIEPRGLSLARLLEPVKGDASQAFTCIVDVEEDIGHLAIVKNRVPYLTRNINLIPRFGLVEPPLEPVAQPTLPDESSVDPRAQRLFSELSVSMDFFMREYPSTTIPRVVLCGEEGLIGSWCQWLADQLHCEVELGSGLVSRFIQDAVPLSFASAVGLLQAQVDPRGASLDFLKRSVVRPALPSRPRTIPQGFTPRALLEAATSPQGVMHAVAAVAVAAACWVSGTLMVKAEQAKLAQIVAAVPEAAWDLSQRAQSELDALKSKSTSQLSVLKPLLDQRVRVAAKLDALVRTLPDGVWITGLDYEDPLDGSGKSQPRLSLKGACFLGDAGKELSAIQQFEEQVKRSPMFFLGFGTAQLAQGQATAREQSTYRTFQLNCRK